MAAVCGGEVLRDVPFETFIANLPACRKQCGDRAVLRAFHVYADNQRVARQVNALRAGDFETFLQLVNESGTSSWEYLQNVIPAGYKEHQEVAVTIAAAKHFLNGAGAVRVHGGGFAGTVQAFVPLEKLDAPVRAILRAGLAQAKFMDVPLPAAVNESVKLAKVFGKTSAAGMVNAMLRRTAALDPKPEHWPDLEERLRTYYCLSQPIAALFAAQYPQDAEEMAAAFYQRRPTAIRVNPLRTTDEALTQTLQQEGHTVTAGPWPHCLLVMFNGNPAASKAFHAGQFHVQGLASQFAALCCDARPGMRVLDLCAAPGGKSLTIAEQMQDRGELFSGEAMTGRVKLLKQAFDRCGIERAKPYHGDATILNPAFGLGSFDRVLCDVPCSGLGVIGKKPDIREKTLDGIENLLLTQQKILQNGAKYLAPNGRLVYSTCTVNHHENEAQVRQFLQDNQDFSVIAPQITLSGMRVGEYGTLFLPHETSTDGFFAAILERQKNC